MKKLNKIVFFVLILFMCICVVNADTPYAVDIPSGNLNTCKEILGNNLTAIVKASITILEILGAIIAIVKGMMILIPPILSHDADELKKSTKTLTNLAIILIVIFTFRPILRFIGNILEFDISCIF